MKNDKRFTAVAYFITILFSVMILYPLLYIVTNAMKDSAKIYDTPPRLWPDTANSLSLVLDYSGTSLPQEELLAALQKDHIITMLSTIYELPKSSIFEIKFYGTQNGKTIYYARAHRTRLDLEKDNGIYRGVAISQNPLTHGTKPYDAAKSLGYHFNLQGLSQQPDYDALGNTALGDEIRTFLAEDFTLTGQWKGASLHKNNALLLESFLHYVKLPSFVYSKNETIAKYSFGVFFFNTAIVLVWAVLTQVVLCAVTAFPLSRLLPKRTANTMLLFFLGTTMIPFVAIMIPQFSMFKSMGLYNNYPALLLPHLLPFGFFVYLYKGFFDNLPGSLFEAAKIDGASQFYMFVRVCMPLSGPIVAVIALQTFLSNWNDFFWAWMVSERQELWTLNVALYNISRVISVKPNFIMGLSTLTILPVLIFTILFSNQIKENLASAGIKG